MLQYDRLWRCLSEIGLDDWRSRTEALVHLRLSRGGHGNFVAWQETLARLRALPADSDAEVRELMLTLAPWRKGPFDVAGITIDSEWRSDMKWARLKDAIEPLQQRNVLDVGCGNGYYARQMQAAGASRVIGADPTLLYVMQFLAVNSFLQDSSIKMLRYLDAIYVLTDFTYDQSTSIVSARYEKADDDGYPMKYINRSRRSHPLGKSSTRGWGEKRKKATNQVHFFVDENVDFTNGKVNFSMNDVSKVAIMKDSHGLNVFAGVMTVLGVLSLVFLAEFITYGGF